MNNIPMGKAVIQHYTTERRKEIIEEGTVNQFRFPFDAKSNYVTKLQAAEPSTEPFFIEPVGANPFLIYCDASVGS